MPLKSSYRLLKNFAQSPITMANCYRPDHSHQLNQLDQHSLNKGLLARGAGLSYNDCCVNESGNLVDMTRLNRFISYDKTNNMVICEPGVTFADLFLIDDQWIPPVIPGTLKATVGGGLANDIHGKNNPQQGTFGHHVLAFMLQIDGQHISVNKQLHPELFHATIGGLGLTGIITQLTIQLKKASHWVSVTREKLTYFSELLDKMRHIEDYDYQVAWLDLLHPERAILAKATHVSAPSAQTTTQSNLPWSIPSLPFSSINRLSQTLFNQLYYHRTLTHPSIEPLWVFNNPLDKLNHWNRLYGPKGLRQFQAILSLDKTECMIHDLMTLIKKTKALPTLAVLKYFNQPGAGLLSFAKPGFTLAIDFPCHPNSMAAIREMNAYMTEFSCPVYMAKDTELNTSQFFKIYPNAHEFQKLIKNMRHPIQSDLARRVGLI